ncbi:MAG: periplasmic heavy metal sensor [Candidatus Margulisiibacteriota bacterium]|jgi:Spy/CpxP family protein refolding chaperone
MNKKHIALMLIITVLAASSLYASAPWQGQGQGKKGPDSQMRQKMFKEMGLTKEQVKASEEIRLDSEKKMIGLRGKVQEKNLDMRAEMRKEPVDEAKIDTLINEIGLIKTELERLRVHNMIKLHKLLTPEQKSKLQEREFQGGMNRRGDD